MDTGEVGTYVFMCLFFQAEDGIRHLVRSRGLGDVYKRQPQDRDLGRHRVGLDDRGVHPVGEGRLGRREEVTPCLLYTSDAADERSSVDLGGRRIIKKNTHTHNTQHTTVLSQSMRQRTRAELY